MNDTRTGLSFLEALQLVFIILKLCKVINWSWWYVLSPTLIGIGLFLIILIYYLFKG